MENSSRRLPIAIVVCLLWVAITLLGAEVIRSEPANLADLVSHGLGFQFLAAIAFLLIVSWLFGWRDLGFCLPQPARRWLLLWFPAIFILGFLALAALLGWPPAPVLFWIAVNTFLVGLSEEWMFRGVLLRALLTRLDIRTAVIMSSVAFGAVHSLNVLLTGELVPALLQSVTAMMSGVLFAALVIRTGSLLPAILYHCLWDLGTFLLVTASAAAPEAGPSTLPLATPILMVLPNFLYALYLLRNVRGKAAGYANHQRTETAD